MLSIVIPAYNEAQRLPQSLAQVRHYLAQLPFDAEVVVVDDGSSDSTAHVVEQLARTWPALRLVPGPHRGKGGAVRAGVLLAHGDWVALADADLSMPIAEFDHFLSIVASDTVADLIIGSREAPGAHRYHEPAYRHIMGRIFNRLVQIAVLPGIQDTQCGFKLLRRTVAQDLCQQQTIAGWGFDVELLYIARMRGYHITEVPVSWYYVAGSRVNPIRDTLTMVRDVLAIRANGRRGRYTSPASAQPLRDASTANTANAGVVAPTNRV